MSCTRILNHDDIAAIVTHVGLDKFMGELIAELGAAFIAWATEDFDVPARTGFNYQTPAPGLMEWMPLHQRATTVFQKAVGYHPENPTVENLPTVISTFVQFDQKTGELLAVADGGLLTAMRTGAASAVATETLTDLSGSITLGLIGSGAQAVTQLHAILQVADVAEVLIFDTAQQTQKSFIERVSPFNGSSIPVVEASPSEIAATSHVMCTATSVNVGAGPVFADGETRPGLHINAIGSDFPGKTELPKSLLKRSLVVPDFPEQAAVEGECQQLARSERGPSLMDMLQSPEQLPYARQRTTVFDSTGWALEDYVALKVAMRHAVDLGIGRQLEMSASNGQPWNPYSAVMTPALTGVE